MNKTMVTFTSCVSDLTYSGHPSVDENFIDCSPREIPWPDTRHHWKCPNTDPVKTLLHLKNLMNQYHQPVTWVINDNEYMNLNGTLPYLKKFQEEGDSILVTYEIIQRPSPVDRKNTEEVLRYAYMKCCDAGIRIDGVWSLKFLQSDINALLRLSADFKWTKNLAGACWLQGNHIDDSGWRGCPFGPYYPAINNIKGCQNPQDNGDLVMMQWLTRDFATGIHLDRIEPYGLDPADPSRPILGGFQTVEQSGEYLSRVVLQTLKNQEHHTPNLLRIHEEVRGYFDEGHDKDIVLDKVFRAIHEHKDQCIRGTLSDAYEHFRSENPQGTNSYLFSGRSLDFRFPEDAIMLYEDGHCQIHFKKSLGNYLYRLYDYGKNSADKDGRYYPESLVPVVPLTIEKTKASIHIAFWPGLDFDTPQPYAIALWEEPSFSRVKADFKFRHKKSYDGNHVILFDLVKGGFELELY